jgi:hypothetical protein
VSQQSEKFLLEQSKKFPLTSRRKADARGEAVVDATR